MSYIKKPAIVFKKPIKIFLFGPSNSGKTYGSLKLATGIVMEKRNCTEEEAYEHIVLIDTEYRRGTLYATMGKFNYEEIKAPYNTEKLNVLIQKIETADDIDVIITDSITHFWVKKGGILDEKNIKDKDGGNSYTNWQDGTSEFNAMLDIILESPKHMIITARSKTDTVLELNAKGKMAPITYGLKPELRDGIEYEFDVVFNIDKDTHNLITVKGIPAMDPAYPPITVEFGTKLLQLFNTDTVAPIRTDEDITESIRNLARTHNMIVFVQLKLSGRKLETLSKEDLLQLELDMLEEIKKAQIKK